MVHDATQEHDTACCLGCDINLLLGLVAQSLVKYAQFAAVALLPFWVEVYNGLDEKLQKGYRVRKKEVTNWYAYNKKKGR